MVLIRRGSAKAKHAARMAWLRGHPELYQGVPGINEDVTDDGRVRLQQLCLRMGTLNLLSRSTEAVQRETVRRLVSELRGEPVGVGW